MSNPENNERSPEPTTEAPAKTGFFRHVLRVLTHNWGMKLGCLAVAVFLWAGLIMQDGTLVRAKVFNDVTINVLNEDSLLRNGFIVVSGLTPDVLTGVRMRVDVPQRVYETAQAANYSVRIDLNRIRSTGRQTLQVLTTNSSTYGTVTDLSVTSIEVEVEEYTTRSRIPVRIATTGTLQEGLYAAAATADPIYVEIAGPRSKVEAVARCVVPYDLSELSYSVGTERTALPFRLENRDEEEIPQDQIITSPLNSGVQIDTITVEQTFYETVSMPVDVESLLVGVPAEGYHVESVSVEPSQIRVAFSDKDDAAGIGNLRAVQPMDIEGLAATRTYSVPLVRPADAKYMGLTAVQLTVEIAKDDEPAAEPAAARETEQ